MGRAGTSCAPVMTIGSDEEGSMAQTNENYGTKAENVRSGTPDVMTLCKQIPERGSPELIQAFPLILQQLDKQRAKWTLDMFISAVEHARSGVTAGSTYNT
jgi:hypothetical protein